MSTIDAKLKETSCEMTNSDSLAKRRRAHHLLFASTTLFIVSLIPLTLLSSQAARCELFGGKHCFSNKRTVLLISMDGFRHDYIERVKQRLGPNSLENFDRLITGGARAMRSVNAYPTITLPNHQTVITGLYPEYHGIVGNNFIDSSLPDQKFIMNDQESLNKAPWTENWPEPIWVTLQKKGRKVGSLLWPLTDGMVHNDRPFQQVSQFTLLDTTPIVYDAEKRVDDILWWLQNPHFHLDLIMAYFNEPDDSGHAFGPDSEEVASTLVKLDERLGQLLDGIEARNLTDKVDIILTSDHGMSTVSKSHMIELDNYVDKQWYNYTQLSTLGFLYPLKEKYDEVYDKLKNAHPYLRVYKLSEVPIGLHFNESSSRMPGLLLIPDPKWEIVQTVPTKHSEVAGDHGYTTDFEEMHPFFIAKGPSFAKNCSIPKINSVDIYPLMCLILGITPNANNGSIDAFLPLLNSKLVKHLEFVKAKAPVAKINEYSPKLLIIMVIVMALTIISFIVIVSKNRHLFEDEKDTEESVETLAPTSKAELCV